VVLLDSNLHLLKKNLLFLCSLIALAATAHAASNAFIQTATGTYDWNTAANWSAGTVPNSNATEAQFNMPGYLLSTNATVIVDVSSPVTVQKLYFPTSSTAATGVTLTISGAAISMNNTSTSASGVQQMLSPTNIAVTIASDLILLDPNGVGFAIWNRTNLSGNVSGGGVFIRSGNKDQELFLGGNNTFSGGISIEAGIIEATTTTAFVNTTGTLTFAGMLGYGGIASAANGTTTLPNAINLGATAYEIRLKSGGTGNTLDITTSSITDGGGTGAISIGRAAAEAKFGVATAGVGTVKFSGTDFTVARNVTGSKFNSSAIELSPASGTQTWSGNFTGFERDGANPDPSIIKSGNGTVILSGRNTYLSRTIVNAGTLELAKQVSLYNGTTASWTTGNISVASGATLSLRVGGAGEFTSANITTLAAMGNATAGFQSGSTLGLNTEGAAGGEFIHSVVIANPNAGSNVLGLTKSGNGTLVLDAANTYTGATLVSAGTLSTAVANAIADASALTVASGAVFALGGNETLASISGAGSYNLGANTLTAGGDNSSTAVSGVLSGTDGSLVKTGAGTLTLSSNNTHTGGITISAGTLQIGAGSTAGSLGSGAVANNASLVFNRSDSPTISNAIGGTGQVTKAGAGALILTATNTYTGATTITSGTLQIGNGGTTGALSASSAIANSGSLAFNHSDDITISNAISGTGNVLQIGGGSTILSGNNTNSGAVTATSGTIQFNGATALSSATSLLSADTASLSLADGTARTTTLTSGDLALTDSGFHMDIDTTSDRLTLSGGSATLTGTNTIHLNFLSLISANATWTLLSAVSGLNGSWVLDPVFSGISQSGFNFSLASTATTLSLIATESAGASVWTGHTNAFWNVADNWSANEVPGGNTEILFSANSTTNLNTSLGADLTVKNLVIEREGVTINSGNTLTANSTGATVFTISAATGTTTINANLAGVGAGLWKSGAGTLVLAGTNTYSGGTSLMAGTLQIASDAALGASTAGLSINPGAGLTATLTAGDDGITLGATRSISLVTGTACFDTNSNNMTIASGIGGIGQLEKTGAGTLTLNGTNTYTGLTTISAGTLAISGGSAIANTGIVTLANTAGVVFSVLGSETIASLRGGGTTGGTTSIAAGQTLTVAESGTNTYAGALANSGNFIMSGAGSLTMTGAVSNSGAIVLSSAGSLTMNGVISGGGSIQLTSTGSLTLGGSNTFTGEVALTAGNLTINHANALNTSGTVTFGGGTLIYGSGVTSDLSSRFSGNASQAFLINTNGNDVTYATALASSSGTLTKLGTGTLTLAGNNTYSGATTISAGTLQIGNGGASGSLATSAITNNGALAFNTSSNFTLAVGVTGTGSLIKANTNTLTLSGVNAYTGATSVTAGTLATSAADRIADTSALTVASGATFQLGGAETVGSIAGAGTISCGSYNLTAGGDNSSTTYSGAITGTGNFTKAGTGNLILSDASLATASIAVATGTLTIGSGTTLSNSTTVTSSANATFAVTSNLTIGMVKEAGALNGGLISLGSGAFLTLTDQGSGDVYQNSISGAGGLIFSFGASREYSLYGVNTYTGGTTINSGIIGVGNSTTGNFAINGGMLKYRSSSGFSNLISDTSTLTVAGGTYALEGNSDTVAGIVLTSGNITSTTGVLSATTFDLQSGNVTAILGGGAGGLTKSTAGTVILSGVNTYTGATNITSGVLSISATSGLGSTSGITISGGGELAYTGGAATLNKNITITAANTGTLRNTGGGLLTLSGAISKNGSDLHFAQGSFAITGGITGANANSDVYYESGGTISLNATNTYNGPTYILNGTTVNANVAGALPTATLSALSLDNSGTGSSVLALGASQAVASLAGAATSTINLGAYTLTVNGTASTAYSGALSGAGGLTKAGSGTLTLNGATAYTGTTTISGGTLTAAAAGALGATTGIVVNTGESLLVTADDAVNSAAGITLGGGTIAFTGTYNGTVGALTLTNDSMINLGAGSIVIHFASLTMNAHALAIYNWTGTTLWNGGDGDNTDQFYVEGAVNASDLSRISFYSGIDANSFVGNGYQILSGTYENEIIPVPEPSALAAGCLLLLAFVFQPIYGKIRPLFPCHGGE
jgi:autotransporter-associated beta strand protein